MREEAASPVTLQLTNAVWVHQLRGCCLALTLPICTRGSSGHRRKVPKVGGSLGRRLWGRQADLTSHHSLLFEVSAIHSRLRVAASGPFGVTACSPQ